MKFSNILSILLVTFLFSGTQADKINLSKQFSKSNPQEKRMVQKSLESKNVDKIIIEKRTVQKNNIFKVSKTENFEKRTIQKITKLSKNKGIVESKNSREECPEGTVDDCSGDGDCCPSEWIGDGYSDCEDQEYGCDLSCYENDGGDCAGENCPEGTVDDCSGDGDCCPSEWIGDGYSDCEDQQYGCDLSCYENDGGDCESDGRGDVSLDREINVLDVVSLTGFVINIDQPSDNEFWAADINQDQTLDILDIVLLIDIIFQN